MIPTRSQYSLRRRARIVSSILPACATSAMLLSLPHSPYPIPLFVEYHNDDIFPLLQHLHPPSNTDDDTEQSPSQGRITINGDTAADGMCELLHWGLNTERHVPGHRSISRCSVRASVPVVDASCAYQHLAFKMPQIKLIGMRHQRTPLQKSEPLVFADKIQYLVMYRRTIHTADILRKTNELH